MNFPFTPTPSRSNSSGRSPSTKSMACIGSPAKPQIPKAVSTAPTLTPTAIRTERTLRKVREMSSKKDSSLRSRCLRQPLNAIMSRIASCHGQMMKGMIVDLRPTVPRWPAPGSLLVATWKQNNDTTMSYSHYAKAIACTKVAHV